MKELKTIIGEAWKKAISYPAYAELIREYALSGMTTGPEQSESLINYTKLNHSRSKRVEKTVDLMEELIVHTEKSEATKWLLITESWCGDAANSVPIIGKLAQTVKSMDLKISFRDENLTLIDHFLTNGGRSIPKLIGLNEKNEVLFDWGPRPEGAQMLFLNWKNDLDKKPFHEFHIDLQKWYNQDRGVSLQKELIQILQKTHNEDVEVV